MWNKVRHGVLSTAVSGALAAAILVPSAAYAHDHHGRGGHGGGWGWGWGLGAGLATGVAIDAAVGWPGYYAAPYAYPYPYPYPYSYPYYAQPVTVIQQAPVVVAPAPVSAPVAAPAAPTAANYYYCTSPKGYYPYVRSCQKTWQKVPVTPPGAPQ